MTLDNTSPKCGDPYTNFETEANKRYASHPRVYRELQQVGFRHARVYAQTHVFKISLCKG
jgi:hypothetical protein